MSKICAPVIIPTLNRVDHLKNCIESLGRNALAKETELYIGLDYPPADKYREGYKDVCKYLDAGIEGFKAVYVFKRDKNLGSFKNTELLEDEVFKKYDRLIFTEDDNIFAPNYLEYMNQCLDKYEDDERAMAVCGYMWPIFEMDNISGNPVASKGKDINASEYGVTGGYQEETPCSSDAILHISTIFSAWGYGIWKDRNLRLRSELTSENIDKIVKNRKLMKNLKADNQFIYSELIKSYLEYAGCLFDKDGNVNLIDLTMGLWMYATDSYMVYPKISKVRNAGNDDTGEHCVDLRASQPNQLGTANPKIGRLESGYSETGHSGMKLQVADNGDSSDNTEDEMTEKVDTGFSSDILKKRLDNTYNNRNYDYSTQYIDTAKSINIDKLPIVQELIKENDIHSHTSDFSSRASDFGSHENKNGRRTIDINSGETINNRELSKEISEALSDFLITTDKEIKRVDISYLVLKILGRIKTRDLLKRLM